MNNSLIKKIEPGVFISGTIIAFLFLDFIPAKKIPAGIINTDSRSDPVEIVY